jgi:hypothetical protein
MKKGYRIDSSNMKIEGRERIAFLPSEPEYKLARKKLTAGFDGVGWPVIISEGARVLSSKNEVKRNVAMRDVDKWAMQKNVNRLRLVLLVVPVSGKGTREAIERLEEARRNVEKRLQKILEKEEMSPQRFEGIHYRLVYVDPDGIHEVR